MSARAGRVRTAGALVALTLILAACTNGKDAGEQPAPPASGSAAAWQPVWSDDFDGAAGSRLSAANWMYSRGTGYPGGARQWGTNEIETMTDDVANVHLDGAGHLAIVPLRTGPGAGRWTSARVETRRTDFAAPEGGAVRIEASLRMPDVSGPQAAGYWAAFWALGAPARPVAATNWPSIGEWDVMENVNGRDSVWHTLHCGVPVGGPCGEPTGISSGELPCPGCRSSFHTYAIEHDRGVTPEELRWYVDGRNTFTVRADRVDPAVWAAANHHGFFVILNVAIGGAFPAPFGGGPTPATKPGVPMLVDRVAVLTRRG
ncbi:family 16 glycosylhydrolase [Couchioplanes caeruleus]|uniref:glycoside hydrolase family 16 protein n=1 Tax=Couchioplanes caeruleus TaxID=56438 RepID=UPI0020BE7E57|nr:glycoside hydrolase family 16 protein [Couchioplanes caeruleus]UQU62846.1 family 16 glycosylhydrolase [Couchioplanes caeruleus]